mmetsp:Transcript_48447/g.154735  ORF Transcript_48447/g.154735 Transcript_48447/m.154735 type:complete len:264 (-) Transcript_48447:620-1411(-)
MRGPWCGTCTTLAVRDMATGPLLPSTLYVRPRYPWRQPTRIGRMTRNSSQTFPVVLPATVQPSNTAKSPSGAVRRHRVLGPGGSGQAARQANGSSAHSPRQQRLQPPASPASTGGAASPASAGASAASAAGSILSRSSRRAAWPTRPAPKCRRRAPQTAGYRGTSVLLPSHPARCTLRSMPCTAGIALSAEKSPASRQRGCPRAFAQAYWKYAAPCCVAAEKYPRPVGKAGREKCWMGTKCSAYLVSASKRSIRGPCTSGPIR